MQVHAAVSAHLDDSCLLYTSDAADDMQCVDLGGRRIIKKKKKYDVYRDRIKVIKNISRERTDNTST